MLNQTRLKQLIVILLTGATGSVLLLNLPTVETTMQYWAYALTFTFLTALSLPLGVLMSEGEISMVHVVGIIAFLTLEDSAVSVTLWALFIGSLAGGAALLLRTQPYLPRRRSVRRSIQTIMVTSARVTLSFYASAQFYFLIGGDLPIRIGGSDVVLPLAEYAAFYIVTYAAIYALELYIEDQNLLQIVRRDWNQIIAILATPVAYAVLAAVIHTTLPYQLFILAVLGLILLITVTFSYSRNQYLLRQQLDEVNALSALGLRLQVSESPDELMRSVQGQLLHILDTHNMIVTQQPPDYEAPHVLLHIHNNERRRTIETADSFLIERIANTGLPVLIEQDVRAFLAEQGGPPVERPVESWLGMPMIVRGRVIGAIALYAAGNRVFSTSDTRRLRIVASTLANALDNARLYQQQEERVARLNTLNTISTLLSSTLSPENVLDTITTSAAMLTEADAVAVYLMNDRQGGAGPQLQRSAGLSTVFTKSPPGLALPFRHVTTDDDTRIPEQPPLIVYDVLTDEITAPMADIFAHEGIRTLIELPLVMNSKLSGAIVLYYRYRRDFTAETIEFMRTFGSEVVQAIKNADLYTRTDEALEKRLIQLSILAAVGQQTNASIDVHTISEVILTFAIDYTESPRGLIVLRNQSTGGATITAEGGCDDASLDQQRIADAFLNNSDMKGRHLSLRQSADIPASQRLGASAASQLVVPILRDRDLLGALVLESDAPDGFDNEATSFIMQLLNQAAIAIDNRNLFQTVTQSRDRLQVILDAMSEAVVLVNEQGHIALANPAVQLIGLEHNAVMRRRITELIEDDPLVITRAMGFTSVNEVRDLLQHLSSETTAMTAPQPHNYVLQTEPSPTFIERHILPLKDDNDRLVGMLLVFYDQTKQVQLDNTREEITRMIVHDLRSPLTAIKTSMYLISQLVPSGIANREKLDEVTGRSQQAVRKMLYRINSLLDVARMESGVMLLDREPFTILEPIQSVFAELKPIADENSVRLKQELMTGDIPLVDADSDKIERVLLNLVDNALKYTAHETDIVVRVSEEKFPAPAVRVEVIDHGPGVPEEYRERLFDRFVQVEGRDIVRSGVGLGLTFCRMVVEAHGGTIQVNNAPEGGAVFAFTLPVASEAAVENNGQ